MKNIKHKTKLTLGIEHIRTLASGDLGRIQGGVFPLTDNACFTEAACESVDCPTNYFSCK